MEIIDFIYYIILGLVQGITEFLPISSSGHIQLIEFLGFTQSSGLFTTIILHFASALSILFIFHKKIKEIIFFQSKDSLSYIFKIIFALVPAVLVGLSFEEQIKRIFEGEAYLLAIMFFITALVLYNTNKIKDGNRNLTYTIVFFVGLSQAFAIMPGISRSGLTICTALFLGISKNEATKFSFIIALPLIFGVVIKSLLFDFNEVQKEIITINIFPLLVAFILTFFVGLLCCKWMIKIVENNKLSNFSYYCFVLVFFLMLTYVK